jgi:hypothetical protein
MERYMQVWSSMLGRKPLDDLPVEAKARRRKSPQLNWYPPMLATLVHQSFSLEG